MCIIYLCNLPKDVKKTKETSILALNIIIFHSSFFCAKFSTKTAKKRYKNKDNLLSFVKSYYLGGFKALLNRQDFE